MKKAEHWRIDAFEVWCWRRLESPLDSKEIKLVTPEGNQPWIFIGRTDSEAETPILWPPDAKSWLIWKDPDAGKDWGAGGERDNRGWDGWMASLTQWRWVWASCGSWWWIGKPGMLQSMGSQRVGYNWMAELNWLFPSLFPRENLVTALRYRWASCVAQQLKKKLPANGGDGGLMSGSGRPPGVGNGNPLQYSCLENTMDRGTWQPTIHEITKSQRQQLNNKNKSIFRD